MIYIGSDFPDEYAHSKDTKVLRGPNEYAKANASAAIKEKVMKSEHFWLTGDEDRPFIAMMISRDISITAISPEISECYEACKKMSLSKEAMHTASQIMSLSGKSVAAKVADLSDTMNALKQYKIKGMKSELIPSAAALGFISTFV